MTTRPADSELQKRMLSGDRDAFADLCRRRQRSVYSFAPRMTGARELAEDVTLNPH
jgi:DNA-directed RNA polymerase specialized sigma24 family protein